MLLHDYELSAAAYSVRLFLALTGQSCRKRPVDVFPGGETRRPAFLSVSACGDLPVLQDGDLTLTSRSGILCYLARQPGVPPHWLPAAPADHARVLDWLSFADRHLRAASDARLADMLGLPADLVDAPRKAIDALACLDDALARQRVCGHAFLLGPQPTIADIGCFPDVVLSVDFGSALEEFPVLRNWTRRIRALPNFISMPGIPEFL